MPRHGYAKGDMAAIFPDRVAMRGTQPAEPDRHARVVGADKGNFIPVRIKQAQREKHVGIRGLRGQPEFGGNRAGDFDACRHRRRAKGQAVFLGVITQRHRSRRRLRRQTQSVRVQKVFAPSRAQERPFVFAA